jgi:WD40-like Beta Propeller Repeat
MMKTSWLLLAVALPCPPLPGQSPQASSSTATSLPEPQIFAPGVISGPANDGAPTFSPDGNTLFFTRSAAHWTVILESHKVNDEWTKPTLATFSGQWPDSSPAFSPDGSYIVFQSTQPATPKAGEPSPDPVSNLWRVDRSATGWSEPKRLPDTVNVGPSIWKPSIAADGTIYLTVIDDKGGKRLFSSSYVNGAYQTAQPLSFSDGKTSDVDPEIAPDGSFLVFCSSGRAPADGKDHLYIVRKSGAGWGQVTPLRYAGDEKPYGYSTDDEPRLGPDHRTLYFSSDRVVVVHFPRTHEHAQQDLERLDSWDNSNSNVWSISLASYL